MVNKIRWDYSIYNDKVDPLRRVSDQYCLERTPCSVTIPRPILCSSLLYLYVNLDGEVVAPGKNLAAIAICQPFEAAHVSQESSLGCNSNVLDEAEARPKSSDH